MAIPCDIFGNESVVCKEGKHAVCQSHQELTFNRYQKVVEIAPSTISNSLRTMVIDSALRIAQKLRYRSLGTFEFLVSPSRSEYYFLEINPRLQVEHTVTETIASTDLVYLQLQIANGRSIKDLGLDIPAADANFPGAVAMQLRVTAEDSRNNFALSVGRINHVTLPRGNGVRVDTHIEPGTVVSADFDSLLAKVIVYGLDYTMAIRKGLRALSDLSIEGVTTNLDLLNGILLSDAFRAGECDTQWLEKNIQSATEAGSAYRQGEKRPEAASRSQAIASVPEATGKSVSIKKGDCWDLSLTGSKDDGPSSHNIRIAKIMRNDFPSSFAAELSISSATSSHSDPPLLLRLTQAVASGAIEGSKEGRKGDPANPNHLVCPLSGQLVEVLVSDGDKVQEYEAVAIIRQMKMELEIRAHRSGTVQTLWDADEGEDVAVGALVCEIVNSPKPKEKL
jgi:acetyl/propionyl-CoA carboxylase alpha subunit